MNTVRLKETVTFNQMMLLDVRAETQTKITTLRLVLFPLQQQLTYNCRDHCLSTRAKKY